MRRKRHYRTGEAWNTCATCGHEFPMSELTVSLSERTRGQLVCTETCVDNLDIERHAKEVQRILGQGVQYEGMDIRHFERRFFGNEV